MVKFNSFICQTHSKILVDEAWKSWVLRNCDSAFPLSCPTPKNYNEKLAQKVLIIITFFKTSSNGEGKYFAGLLGLKWLCSSFQALFSIPVFFLPLSADLRVRYRMWPRRSHHSSSDWGRAVQCVCLLKHTLSQECTFTTCLVCDLWMCQEPGVSWAWHRDLRKGGRPLGSSSREEWAMAGDLHLRSNHRTQGYGDWSETILQGEIATAVRQAGKPPRRRCYRHSN